MDANSTHRKQLVRDFLPEIRAAAAENNGKPLTVGQRERVVMRARFLQVVRLAGYSDGTKIVEKHFEEYMKDVRDFTKMLQEYEYKYTGETMESTPSGAAGFYVGR